MGPGAAPPVLALVLCTLEHLLHAGAALGTRRREKSFPPFARSPIIESRNEHRGKGTQGLLRVVAEQSANKKRDSWEKQKLGRTQEKAG